MTDTRDQIARWFFDSEYGGHLDWDDPELIALGAHDPYLTEADRFAAGVPGVAAALAITEAVPSAATLARTFHEAYERLAPDFGYKTREASAVPWDDVPAANKALMQATAAQVVGVLRLRAVGAGDDTPRPPANEYGVGCRGQRTCSCQQPADPSMVHRNGLPCYLRDDTPEAPK